MALHLKRSSSGFESRLRDRFHAAYGDAQPEASAGEEFKRAQAGQDLESRHAARPRRLRRAQAPLLAAAAVVVAVAVTSTLIFANTSKRDMATEGASVSSNSPAIRQTVPVMASETSNDSLPSPNPADVPQPTLPCGGSVLKVPLIDPAQLSWSVRDGKVMFKNESKTTSISIAQVSPPVTLVDETGVQIGSTTQNDGMPKRALIEPLGQASQTFAQPFMGCPSSRDLPDGYYTAVVTAWIVSSNASPEKEYRSEAFQVLLRDGRIVDR